MSQESEEGICPYLGRSPDVWNIKEKSAEAIVPISNELRKPWRPHKIGKGRTGQSESFEPVGARESENSFRNLLIAYTLK